MAADPLTRAYDAVIEVLKANYKNVVSWNSSRGPLPDKIQESDLPEVQLVPSGLVILLGNTSCATTVDASYEIITQSGDKRLGQIHYPALWKMLCVLSAIKYDAVLSSLSYVDDLSVQPARMGLAASSAENRGLNGWVSLMSITLHMSFTKQDLEL